MKKNTSIISENLHDAGMAALKSLPNTVGRVVQGAAIGNVPGAAIALLSKNRKYDALRDLSRIDRECQDKDIEQGSGPSKKSFENIVKKVEASQEKIEDTGKASNWMNAGRAACGLLAVGCLVGLGVVSGGAAFGIMAGIGIACGLSSKYDRNKSDKIIQNQKDDFDLDDRSPLYIETLIKGSGLKKHTKEYLLNSPHVTPNEARNESDRGR